MTARDHVMKYQLLTVVVLLVSAAPLSADDVQEIPLDQIWAYEMPGTRDILSISTGRAKELDRMLLDAALVLTYDRAHEMNFKDVARPGFVVSGADRSALHGALAVFIDWDAQHEKFSCGAEFSLVFFSEPLSRYQVQIRKVHRTDENIEIQYELMPDESRSSFTNLALIPLGKLPVGEYDVTTEQLAHKLTKAETLYGFKEFDQAWSDGFLCKPFKFKVMKSGEDRK